MARKKQHGQKASRQRRASRLHHAPRKATAKGSPRQRGIAPLEHAAVRQALGLLRKHIKGYEPSDGYGFRAIETFDSTKRKRLKARAQKLKQILSTPHDVIKPKTKKDRQSLVAFTRQKLRGAKHFIAHKPGDNFRVKLRGGNVSVRGAFPGRVATESRYFLFSRRPKHPDDVGRMLKSMLSKMPEGFYTILTGLLGDTGEPVEKGALLARLREYMNTYGTKASGETTGFTESIVGFRFMSSKLRGAEVERAHVDMRRDAQRELNRAKDKAWKAEARGKKAPKVKLSRAAQKLQRMMEDEESEDE